MCESARVVSLGPRQNVNQEMFDKFPSPTMSTEGKMQKIWRKKNQKHAASIKSPLYAYWHIIKIYISLLLMICIMKTGLCTFIWLSMIFVVTLDFWHLHNVERRNLEAKYLIPRKLETRCRVMIVNDIMKWWKLFIHIHISLITATTDRFYSKWKKIIYKEPLEDRG